MLGDWMGQETYIMHCRQKTVIKSIYLVYTGKREQFEEYVAEVIVKVNDIVVFHVTLYDIMMYAKIKRSVQTFVTKLFIEPIYLNEGDELKILVLWSRKRIYDVPPPKVEFKVDVIEF